MKTKTCKRIRLLSIIAFAIVLSVAICFIAGCSGSSSTSVQTGTYKRQKNGADVDNSYINVINNSQCKLYNILDEDGTLADAYNNEKDDDEPYNFKYYDGGKKVELTVFESVSGNKKETWYGSYSDKQIKLFNNTYKLKK